MDFHKHILYQSNPLMKIINEYLDIVETEKGQDVRTGASSEFLINTLELTNETECPTLELVEEPKVNFCNC